MRIVDPTTVTDTTGDTRWTPVRVVATLTTPAVGIDAHPLYLDGPLSWGAYRAYIAAHGHGALPPMTHDRVIDFALPLATWTQAGTWGWACSRAHYTVDGWSTAAMRRRPAVEAMARMSNDAKHHLAAGPDKARDTPLPVALVDTVTWWALADPDLQTLLDQVWSLGRHGRHGHGQVASWTVTPDPDALGRWTDRVFPHPEGEVQRVRAPYHHPTCRVPAR